MNTGKLDKLSPSQNNSSKKNIVGAINNKALAVGIVIAAGLFYLGNLNGRHSANLQNKKIKQAVLKQQQTIKNLKDTILIMKLNQQDTIVTLQDPARDTPLLK